MTSPDDGRDAAATAALLAGRYRLIEPVGRGGMAEVWRGEDVRLGRQVAVKLIIKVRGGATIAADDAADEVRREARDAARLVHPNVVGVYDVGVDGGRLFIVMEWVAGRDLATVLFRHGPFPALEVAWIGAQTARALAAAHEAGIVHRDVKPANLILTRGSATRPGTAGDGVVKLADFGIATRAGSTARDALDTGPLVGTTAYVAPEQVLGHPASPASDLYGLGCALYELLVGRPPFTGDDPVQVVRRHLAHDPTPPSRLRADVPAPLERLIMRLLTKDAASRPADAPEVAQALESMIATHRAAGVHPAIAAAWTRPHREARPTPTAHLPAPPAPPAAPHVERAPSADRRRWGHRAAMVAAPVAFVMVIAVAVAIAAAWGTAPARQAWEPALGAPAPAGPTSRAPATRRPPRVRPPVDAVGPDRVRPPKPKKQEEEEDGGKRHHKGRGKKS
jgi:eukaryotic-like serine/threonine-protein kinase